MSHFQIPIFSTLVGWLADMMAWAVQFFYNLTASLGFPSYGIAIIILTIVIKVLLLPFALKQIKSMKGMQEIQPKVAALQKKYKNDRAKLSIEMQKLYREHNISPLAGCLPLLIQMPFLVSIFYALQGFQYDSAHASFLWLSSLASKDPTYVLPILSAVSTWALSAQTAPKNAEGPQKMMTYFMPLFIGYISINFPSGLVIYWVVSNLFQLVQQTIVFHKDKGLRSVINNDSREKKGVFTIHADGTRDNAPKGKRHTPRDARRAKRVMRKELEEAIEGKVDHDSDSKE
ncbi:YidC/Oxa1 family membrane protein insertase [Dialister histaminiformans]|uniref:YidC/Oxa1 family membrane protein insertase n=1 Tax=Allisonella histaminiformans TaxID=209880 RepID=A0A1G5W390_9FIRM|nr:YidC/Oxa1 family membrane protein insertase [Allisonella histaminiformans]MCI6002709.1 YidC/Oxa1 family membrane protein insertase [Allisonella histaminiformans]SDA51987.1 YidC/Oxa1 family membrane protein insertase [Allisonella histaminiformans]